MDKNQESTNGANVQNLKSTLPFWRQLRWNLILYFIALAVIPLAITLTIALILVDGWAEVQISGQLESAAELRIDQIDRWLEDSDLVLDYFLSSPVRTKLVTFLTAATLDQTAQNQLNQILADALERPKGSDRENKNTQFVELFIYNRSGEIVAASASGRIGQIVANQPYFAASLSKDVIQPPYYELGQTELTIVITKLLRDEQSNQIVGVLAGRLDLNELSKIMTNTIGLGESGETYLVSPENNYLVTASRFESEGYTRSRAYHSEGIDRALARENGSTNYPNYHKPAETVIGIYRWLPKLQVGLLAEMTEAEVEATVTTVFNFSLGIAVAAILVAIGVGFYIAAHMSGPLISLTQVANRIAGGDLSQQAKISARNEIGLLAATFNGMTGQLQRLFGTLEDRNRRLEIVANLGERLSAILNMEELLAATVNQVKANFGYYHAHIYLLDDRRRNLVMAEGTGSAGAEMKAKGHHIPFDAPISLVARAARTREIVRVDNIRETADWLPNPLLPATHSEIAVPIILEGRVVGVLDVQSDKIAGLDEGDVNLLRTLANQVAVAIRNARLFREVETALAEARAAQERYLAQAWDKTKIVTQGGQYRYTRSDAPLLDEVAVAEAKQRVLLQNRPAIITINSKLVDRQTSDEELDIQTQNAKPENCNSFALVAPVTLGNKTIGALQLHRMNSTAGVERGDQPWTDQDLALVEAVLDQVGQAAETLRLFDETREWAGREQAIREITDKLRTAPTLKRLVEIATEELRKRLSATHAKLELGFEVEENNGTS